MKTINAHVMSEAPFKRCIYCGADEDDAFVGGEKCVDRPNPVFHRIRTHYMKLIEITIKVNDYEFSSHSLHHPRASAEKYLRSFYEGGSEVEGNGWRSFQDGEVWARVTSEKLITEEQAAMCRELGVAA